ncbi:MAG: sigma 54-interacting transcriptional regulator [Desulfobacterales bacterium]|nr:sigma 54-interacting transcriptional regulator [Desulfobacterales bacterium]
MRHHILGPIPLLQNSGKHQRRRFTIDSQKRIISFNRAAEIITGFKTEEAVGQFCFDIFRADICEKNCALDRTLADGVPQINLPAKIISKTGQPKQIRLSTAIFKSEDGHVIGAVETFRDVTEFETLRRRAERCFMPEDIVGSHPRITEILSFLPDIAESESIVIIEGPTGSGKELIARAIHQLSPRKAGPFVALNCAALPDSLLESELFGYAKGAFTGATTSKPGRFQTAHGGTLFLDEISNTSLNFQADLLRVLQDGQITPLGSNRSSHVDVRIVAASNKELDRLTREGQFRQDLYYRLNVVKISLPALRERKQDIALLADHFIRRFNLRKERNIQGVSRDVLSFFMDYSFPGNVRELQNIIEYAFIVCKGPTIDIVHLPKDLFQGQETFETEFSDTERMEVEKLRAMIRQYPDNRPEVARILGISRTTLWRKMKKYGLI